MKNPLPNPANPLFNSEEIGGISRWFALLGRATLILVAVVFPAPLQVLADFSSDELTRLENTTDRWIELKRRSVEARAQWESEREVLVRTKRLLEAEQGSLVEQIDSHKVARDLFENNIERVAGDLQRFTDAHQVIESRFAEFDLRTRLLLDRLPDPLKTTIRPMLNRSVQNEDSEVDELANHVQNLIALLSMIDHFANTLTLTHTLRRSTEGQEFDVTVLYWGLAFAFAADARGERGWFVSPGEDGWVWEDRRDKAAAFKDLIDVFEKRRQPDLVTLPVRMQK